MKFNGIPNVSWKEKAMNEDKEHLRLLSNSTTFSE